MFTLMTVGITHLLISDKTIDRWKTLRCILNTQRLTEEDSMLSFGLCGWQFSKDQDNDNSIIDDETGMRQWQQHAMETLALIHHCGLYLSSAPRKVTSKPATKWSFKMFLDCWLGILSVEGLHLWLFGAPIYWSPIGIDTVENSQEVFWIYRDLLREIQYFGLICVIGNLLRITHWRWYIPDKKQERMLILDIFQ